MVLVYMIMMFPQAGASLSVSQDQLVRVHRALHLLNSHLETFRRKYAYHLR